MRPSGYHGGDELDRAAEGLINVEVLACQSSLIDTMLSLDIDDRGSFPDWDAVENLFRPVCPECSSPDLKRHDGGESMEDAYSCESCDWTGGEGSEHELDSEPQGIFEWWLVTSWLAIKLGEKGHPILSDGQSHWWGRCTTGQAILLDGVIQAIVQETGYRGWKSEEA